MALPGSRPPVVRVECAFDHPVDRATAQALRESLRAFLAAEPGYVAEAAGDATGDAVLVVAATWATNRDAFVAAERAGAWRERQARRFGWRVCDAVFVPGRAG